MSQQCACLVKETDEPNINNLIIAYLDSGLLIISALLYVYSYLLNPAVVAILRLQAWMDLISSPAFTLYHTYFVSLCRHNEINSFPATGSAPESKSIKRFYYHADLQLASI